MSFNRSLYDDCTYKNEMNRNVGILGYILNTDPFVHSKNKRNEFGMLGGNAVSHINGNLTDLESDLRSQTRYVSKCCNSVAMPVKNNQITNDKTAPIDVSKRHLNGFQHVPYNSIPIPYSNFINNERCIKK